MRSTRGAALALVAGLLFTLAPTQTASATEPESAADAQAAAQHAADQVAALQPRVERALRAYQRALAQISGAVTRSISADQRADETAARALAERRQVDNQVRALYMSGGSAGLVVSVLTAPTATDALRRVAYVQRLVQTTGLLADNSATVAQGDAALATRLQAVAEHQVVTAADVTRRYKKLNAALAEAGAALSQLSDHARSLAAAEAATAQLQALASSAAAAATDRVATARAAPVPADFRKLYVGAAKTCPGLSWSVLAAIGQVESGHGRNAATSYAGAQGPMQFLPATFAAYAVDGDHDGDTDIQDPADAIFTAAHYLCANGGGHGDAGLHNAIWHYNHAEWYVALVLKLAGELDGQKPAITIGG